MKIQKRLRLSYILMLLIPAGLIMLSGIMYRDHYRDRNDRMQFTPEFYSLLYRTMAINPEELQSIKILETLSDISGYDENLLIVVEREDSKTRVIFGKDEKFPGKHPGGAHSYSGSSPFSFSWNFYFSDNTQGKLTASIFDSRLMGGFFRQGVLIFLVITGILILTNGILSYLVAKSITTPLNLLNKAAHRIKDEDLNTPLIYERNDEFQDLCRSFEEMRIRLKDSLHEQIKSEENRKELLSSISHDLKTPITAIRGYIEGIKDGVADSPEMIEKYIETIHSKTTLMNTLIDRLFLFSKLDLNRVQFNFQNIDLLVFIRDICDELMFDYPLAEITLDTVTESEIIAVADRIHLHRVVTNLVDNAVKYNDKDIPEIRIILSLEKDKALVSIKDNGRGISEKDLPLIFDRFYRSDPARSSQTEGSGLGLAISKQIIEAHGGIIRAISGKGEGSEIKFTLRTAK